MLKSIVAKIILVLSVSIISNVQADEHKCVPLRGLNCKYEYKLNCPRGFIDGCETGETAYHACIPTKGPDCKYEVVKLCPEGFINGCFFGESSEHKCVPIVGPSCDVEIFVGCPVGFVDYCSLQY